MMTMMRGAPAGTVTRTHAVRAVVTVARARRCVVARAAERTPASGESTETDIVGTRVTLRMPTGLVFAQKTAGGPVVVDEVVPGGAADESGQVSVGDVLAACSAVSLKGDASAESAGHGDFLFDKYERIMFPTAGEEFKTVMGALKSNSPRWGYKNVVMVFQKPGNHAASA